MCRFKEGDIVVRKIFGRGGLNDFKWGGEFIVHTIGYNVWTQEPTTLYDVHLNGITIKHCELKDIALSPLFEALQEDDI